MKSIFRGKSLADLAPRKYRGLLRHPLIVNAWYLVGVSLFPGLMGFLFWKFCSYFYTPADIGLGSAVLSAAALVANISNLGINAGLVFFLPKSKDRIGLINSSIAFTLLNTLACTSVFFIGLPIWSPKLLFLRNPSLYFVGFCALVLSIALGTTLRGVYVARRMSKLAFFYTFLANILCLAVLGFFMAAPLSGIIQSNAIGYLAAMLVSWWVLLPRAEPRYRFGFVIKWTVLKSLISFTLANYIAQFLFQSYQTVFPLLILNILGSDASGYAYIPIMIVGFVVSPGMALGYSAFSEGSNDLEHGEKFFQRAIVLGGSVTVLLALIVGGAAPWILLLFGKQYVNHAASTLTCLAAAAPFVVVNQIYSHFLRFKGQVRELIVINLAVAVISFGVSVALLRPIGISAVGLGLLLGNALIMVFLLKRMVQNVFRAAQPASA